MWRNRDFVSLWSGQSVSYLGSQVTIVALPLTAAAVLHAGPVQMGILAALNRVPYLIFGLFIGVWVDRLSQRTILIFVNIALAATLGVIPLAAAGDWLNMTTLYAVTFTAGTLAVLFDIAYLSFVPALVDPHHLVGAQGMVETTQSSAQLAGPVLGGWLIQVVTAPIAVLFDTITYLIAAGSVLLIRPDPPRTPHHGIRPKIWTQVGQGLRVVFGQPALRTVTLCTATYISCFSGFSTLFLLYLVRDLHVSPWLLGVVFGIGAAGGLVGAVLAGTVARRFGAGRTMAWSLAVSGLGAATAPLIGSPGSFTIALVSASYAVAWFGQQMYNVVQVPLRYVLTPEHLRGRSIATIRSVVWGAVPGGALLGGYLGQHLGLPTALVVTAAVASCASLWIFLSPLVRLQRITDLSVPPADHRTGD